MVSVVTDSDRDIHGCASQRILEDYRFRSIHDDTSDHSTNTINTSNIRVAKHWATHKMVEGGTTTILDVFPHPTYSGMVDRHLPEELPHIYCS